MNMKKILLIGAMFLVMLARSVPLGAQTFNYTIEDKVAKWYIQDVRPDEVWAALIKALETMHWKVMKMTDDGSMIHAMANLPNENDPMKKPRAIVRVEGDYTKILVTGTWYIGQIDSEGRIKFPIGYKYPLEKDGPVRKFWKELFERMAGYLL
jgi:hypothetical protein